MATTDIQATRLFGLDQQTPQAHGPKKLGQNDFMKLLLTQLQAQDPFQPEEHGEFISQMAQFGTVDGIADLKESLSTLTTSLTSNQALQASSLVGRKVHVPSEIGVLIPKEGLTGTVNLDRSSNQVAVTITDGAGTPVKHLNLGQHPAGAVEFQWDGKDDNGKTMPPGSYRIAAALKENGKYLSMPTLAQSNVDSVTITQNGGGLMLNVNGLGTFKMDDVLNIA